MSVSSTIMNSKHRNSGGVVGAVKCEIISFSLVMDANFPYSSSTHFFSICLFSRGTFACA